MTPLVVKARLLEGFVVRYPIHLDAILTAAAAMRDSMEVSRGFGGGLIKDFEVAFAAYVGTKHAVALNSARACRGKVLAPRSAVL